MAILAGAVIGCAAPGPDDPPPADPATGVPCDRGDFLLAPAPRFEPGPGLLAPIDIDALFADVVIDVAAHALLVTAELRFVAPPSGRPVFQLLPPDIDAQLDGESVLIERAVVSEPPRSLALLPPLEPCSEHELITIFSVHEDALADAPLPALRIGPGTAWWSSAQDDGVPDSMLERFLPSNLLFDRYPMELDVSLVGAKTPHRLVANGEVVGIGPDRWSVSLPSRQPHGSFWVLHPEAGVTRTERMVDLPSGAVTVELYAFAQDEGVDLEAAADMAEETLIEYDARLGPYLHGDRYLGWLRSDLSVSMEYEGATLSTPGALQHEIAHSWYGRGVAPVSEFHGWIDEGMATWVTGENPYFSGQIPTGTAGLRLLVGEDGWSGAGLDLTHYLQGSLVFGGIAWQVGPEALLAALRTFYASWGPEPITTEDLEHGLYCSLGDPYVLDVFHNRVRGRDGYPDPPADDCSDAP